MSRAVSSNFLAVISAVSLLASLCVAVELHIDAGSGSDATGTGSSGNPYRTVAHAVSVSLQVVVVAMRVPHDVLDHNTRYRP